MGKLLKNGALAGSAMSLLPVLAYAEQADYNYGTTDASANAVSGGVVAVIFAVWGVLVIGGILLLVFWVVMLIDVLKRTNWKQESDKTLWILLVILLGYLGAIIYYFAIKRQLDAKKSASK